VAQECHSGGPIEISETQSSDKAVPSLKHSILVIDDCTDALALQRLVLEMEGFEVFTGQSGTEALEILTQINPPDLILLDMHMEDMNGSEFLVLLEEKIPQIIENVPIVFLTASNEIPSGKAAGFIRKATDLKIFLKAVHGFIGQGPQTPSKH